MIAWLLAFAVHSTLWLCLAWLWTRLRPHTHARLRETIWYTAIAASFLTPTAQTFVSSESAIWRLPLPVPLMTAEADHIVPETSRASLSAHTAREGAEHDHHALTSGPPGSEAGVSWRSIVYWTWLSIAGVLVLQYCGRLQALRKRLGQRESATDSRARRVLLQLTRRAGLRKQPLLTESENLGSPIALGFSRSAEICVPTRAFHELDQDQFFALLGHEVAHHLRWDTVRLAFLNLIQAVFFFQPLLRRAVRAVRCAAEEQCDDWAARHVDDRLAMASCLTEVAAWIVPKDRRLPVPCMARRRSQISLRVDRLMDEGRRKAAPSRIWRGFGSAGLLMLAPWLAPATAPAGEHSHTDAASVERIATDDGDSAAGGHHEFQTKDED